MEERELLILNPAPFVWQHKDSQIPKPFTVSKFFFDIDMGMFQIKEGRGGSGAARFPYSFDKITIKVGNGAVEGPFPNEVALLTRLRQLNYPGYIEMVNAFGLISIEGGNILRLGNDGLLYVPDSGGGGSTTYIADGANTTVSGSGSFVDPYMINAEAGGSQDLQQTTENGAITNIPIVVGDPTGVHTTHAANGVTVWLGDEMDEDTKSIFVGNDGVLALKILSKNDGFTAPKVSLSENQFDLRSDNEQFVNSKIVTDADGIKENILSNGKTINRIVPQSFTDVGTGNELNITTADASGDFTEVLTVNGIPADPNGNVTVPTGGGAVSSVNGQTGDIVLTQDDVLDGTTYKQYSATEKTKLAGIASGATANTGTVTSVTGVSNETTVASGTTTPVIGISSNYTTARDAVANAKVENNLTASTTVAPSKTAVNTALALKADLASPTFTGTPTAPTATAASNNTQLANTAYVHNELLGFARTISKDVNSSPTVSGTTKTMLYTIPIEIGTYAPGDVLKIATFLNKVGVAGGANFRIEINTSNTLTGATPIGIVNMGASNLTTPFVRNYNVRTGGILEGFPFSSPAISDESAAVAAARSTTSFDNTTTKYWLFIDVQNINAADTTSASSYALTKL